MIPHDLAYHIFNTVSLRLSTGCHLIPNCIKIQEISFSTPMTKLQHHTIRQEAFTHISSTPPVSRSASGFVQHHEALAFDTLHTIKGHVK
ncbi:hypothetical protein A0H81_01383 [Grifola frondosa]|uniref:Uncharacterized protein n=1 Tax=Grifola frondosa TaxID=5627 RepID=A0A1C7MUF8_GRIFR|nr:hypothetical protein A0H81_01383 [Grifola frondosa]